MRILVLGSGGREHALAWKLSADAEIHSAPGNPGIAAFGTCHDVPVHDQAAVLDLASALTPDLIVIGPENPLIDGLADALREAGFATFGPGRLAAQLEGSKAYAKSVMVAAGVPTAESETCESETAAVEAVKRFLDRGMQVVVKASGNALGKGVVVPEGEAEALEAIRRMMVEREFGDAGRTLVIEERLFGREFSLITLCSGINIWSFPVAQDYKRVSDGDSGPNTGGMGAYSPVGFVTPDLVAEAEARMVRPALAAMQEAGLDYRGALFTGVMATDRGPKCLEYNVRFGDPETECLMMRTGAGLADALQAVALGEPIPPPVIDPRPAVGVVLANAGYPGPVSQQPAIMMPEPGTDEYIFHMGTRQRDDALVATGGRVACACALGANMAEARERAYALANRIRFEGRHFRRDIAADAE